MATIPSCKQGVHYLLIILIYLLKTANDVIQARCICSCYQQIPVALDMAKDIRRKDDAYLFKKVRNDRYMRSAVEECYETLRMILFNLLVEEEDKK